MGASNYIRNVMVKALGEDKSQSVLSRIAPSASARPIEILDWMDARSISELMAVNIRKLLLWSFYLDAGLGADVLGLFRKSPIRGDPPYCDFANCWARRTRTGTGDAE